MIKLFIVLFILLNFLQFIYCIIKVNPENQFFVDEYGRVRIFHGVNVVYKIPPYHPNVNGFDPVTSFSSIDYQNLVDWGFNSIRLGVMWPGVEPELNQYNQTYIELMNQVITDLGEKGIYTIVDFHQDLISRKFCGEGLPDWIVNTLNDTVVDDFPSPVAKQYPVNSVTEYPELDQCLSKEFAVYYFSKNVGHQFQKLYDNIDGTQDKFIDYWRQLVGAFKNQDTVLGYEIINEPWAGDIYEHPDLLLKLGYADEKNLLPLYKAVSEAIREIDDQHCIFYEKALTDVIHSYFPKGTPGGIEYNDRQVLSYHIYCGTNRNGNPSHENICDGEDDLFFQGAMKDLKQTGGGGFMTEFGAVSNETNSIEMLQYLTGKADEYLQSWTYWALKYYYDITTAGSTESLYLTNGELDIIKLTALSRTYAQAIAGVPISMEFNPITCKFTLSYTIDTSITQPTVIYLNQQLNYPNGFTSSITQGIATIQPQTTINTLTIIPSSSTIDKSTITIEILKN